MYRYVVSNGKSIFPGLVDIMLPASPPSSTGVVSQLAS